MNALFPKIGSAQTWPDRISLAKAARNNGNPWQERFHLERIADEAADHGNTEWSNAAQYALDTGDYGEADWLIEQELREESLRAISARYRGNELPDWRFNQIVGAGL